MGTHGWKGESKVASMALRGGYETIRRAVGKVCRIGDAETRQRFVNGAA